MRINEIRDIVKRLGVPSACGGIMQMGRFFDQHPDGLYITQGGGPAVAGWDDFSVFVGRVGEMENLRRLEIELYASGKAEGMEITRIGGHYVLSFRTRIAGGGSGVFFGGGSQPSPDDFWGLKLKMPEGGTVILRKNGNPNAVSLEVSTDGANWQPWTLVGTDYSYTLQTGETLCIRNTSTGNPRFSKSSGNYWAFNLSSTTYASGDIMSLVSNTQGVASLDDEWFIFAYLFQFQSNLKTMPELTPTQLSTRCFYCAFQGTGITETTTLPASVLTNYCYGQMFSGCNYLNVVKTNMTDISASGCLNGWLSGVSATGDFYCPAELTIPTGASGIPSGWTRHDI